MYPIEAWKKDSKGPHDNYGTLEDNYFNLKEQNQELKKKSHEQEDKIRKLATKLIRLSQDVKKRQRGGGIDPRDELESEYQYQLSESKRQIESLNNKVRYFKHLAGTSKPGSSGSTLYSNVTSRIDTGRHKRSHPPSGRGGTTTKIHSISQLPAPQDFFESNVENFENQHQPQPPPVSDGVYVDPKQLYQVLVRGDVYDWNGLNHQCLQDFVSLLKDHQGNQRYIDLEQQCAEYRQQLEELRHKFQEKSPGGPTVEELERLKEEVLKQNSVIQEKETRMNILESKNSHINESLKAIKITHTELLEKMEALNKQLLEEKHKTRGLEHQFKMQEFSQESDKELNQLIQELRVEKEETQRLLNKAFSDANVKEEHWQNERQLMKDKIISLEKRLNVYDSDTSKAMERHSEYSKKLEERIKELKEEIDTIGPEKQKLKVELFDLQQKYEFATDKLNFLADESGADVAEIEHAILYLRNKKHHPDSDPDIKQSDMITELQTANTQHLVTIEKTDNLLKIQESLNADYKIENEELKKEMYSLKEEFQMRLDDQARLLDAKRDALRKLETQLHSLLYKQLGDSPSNEIQGVGIDEQKELLALNLDDSENAVEFQISTFTLSGASFPPDVDTFINFDFFEHETVVTPILTGLKTTPQIRVFYIVKPDNYFLLYLKAYSMPFEVFRAQGFDYTLIGTGAINFKALLTRHDKFFATVEIISSVDNTTVIGTLSFSIRMFKSMEDEIRAYNTLQMVLPSELDALRGADVVEGNFQKNELVVKVLSGYQLKNTHNTSVPPSAFVFYKFYDFPESDTAIVRSDTAPEFNDLQAYPLHVTKALTHYLSSKTLDFVIFDDNDPSGDSYLGIAKVPLKNLTQDKMIDDFFDVFNFNNTLVGKLQVQMYWRYPFKAPLTSKAIHPQTLKPAKEVIQYIDKKEENQIQIEEEKESVIESIITPVEVLDQGSEEIPSQKPLAPENHIESDDEEIDDILLKIRERKKKRTRKENDKNQQKGNLHLTVVNRTPSKMKNKDVGVTIVIEKLTLTDSVLKRPTSNEIMVSYDFLDMDNDTYTPAFSIENHPFTFNHTKHFPLVDYHYKLFSMLTSLKMEDAEIFFDICNKLPSGVVNIIGSAEVNLHVVKDYGGGDLIHENIEVRDTKTDLVIGQLQISLIALNAFEALMESKS